MRVSYKILTVLYFILTAVILCVPAFYNGYPLFYTDSALYLEAAHKLMPTIERPIGYGIFIRLTSWEVTLWSTVLIQGIITSLLIYHSMIAVIKADRFKRIHHLIAIVFLSLFTSLGWFVGQLMPDIFSGFLVLAFYNVVYGKNNLLSYILYAILTGIIIFSHLSNIPLLMCLIIITGIISLFTKSRILKIHTLRRLAFLALVFGVSLLSLAIYNYRHFSRLSLSPSGAVFFFARLIDTGVVDTYLKEDCISSTHRICAYKDSIPPASQAFLWHTDGIFYKMGGWQNYYEEAGQINKAILTSPKYYKTLLWHFARATALQLVSFNVGGDFYNFTDGSWRSVYDKSIENFSRDEMRISFLNTRQSREMLKFSTLNYVYNTFIIISLILIIVYFSRLRILSDYNIKFIICIIFGVVCNAAICANLSNVLNRYQSRVIWLLPLAALVIVFDIVSAGIKDTG